MLFNNRKIYNIGILLYYNRKISGERMKAIDHLGKAKEIKASIELLQEDEKHVIAIVELAYGLAQHLIAYGMDKKCGEHRDTHHGIPALLRKHEQLKIATLFEQLDTFRHGRWYGGKGNGDVLKETLKIIDQIERWATG